METNKALTADQLEKLRTAIRQRFDDLYHRIGTSRQKLATMVLLADQAINKELTKEKIDTAREKEILRELRDIEKIANNQLPHVHKAVVPVAPVAPIAKTTEVKPPAKKTATPKSKVAEKPKAKGKKK